jgi:HSP20 family molecular chaperone IbpA
MERLSLFSSPLFLGFDHFERLIDSLSKAQEDAYPPYNIEQIGERGFRITLALAGFRKENIHISLENNQLTIRGKQETDHEAVYLYRGIATRQFARTFVLADGMEVKNAEFDNGLLHLNLMRVKGDDNIRTIEITSKTSEHPQLESISPLDL